MNRHLLICCVYDISMQCNIIVGIVIYPYTNQRTDYAAETNPDGITHRVESARLPLQSSELAPSPPHPQATVAPPPLWFQGGTHYLAGEGAGGANSDERTDTVVL
jgi:hypothetical protein